VDFPTPGIFAGEVLVGRIWSWESKVEKFWFDWKG